MWRLFFTVYGLVLFVVNLLLMHCFLSSGHLHSPWWTTAWTTGNIPPSLPLNGTATLSLTETGPPALRTSLPLCLFKYSHSSNKQRETIIHHVQSALSKQIVLSKTTHSHKAVTSDSVKMWYLLSAGRCPSPCHPRVTPSWWWSRQGPCSGLSPTCSGHGGSFQNPPEYGWDLVHILNCTYLETLWEFSERHVCISKLCLCCPVLYSGQQKGQNRANAVDHHSLGEYTFQGYLKLRSNGGRVKGRREKHRSDLQYC